MYYLLRILSISLDDATLLLTTYFGYGTNLLNVDVYTFTVGLSTVYATIAKADCTPVSISETVPNWPSMYTVRYISTLPETFSFILKPIC